MIVKSLASVPQLMPNSPHVPLIIHLQWKPSKADTIGTKNFVRYSEVITLQPKAKLITARTIILILKYA